MPRNCSTVASKGSVVFHREILAHTRALVASWAVTNAGRRDSEATSILVLLEDCSGDTDGDTTLDAISSILEEFNELISPRLERQFAALAKAAFGLTHH